MHRLECGGGGEAGERKLPLRFDTASKVEARNDADKNGAVAPERRLHYCPGDSPCSRRIFSLDGPIMLFLLCQLVYCEVIAFEFNEGKGSESRF